MAILAWQRSYLTIAGKTITSLFAVVLLSAFVQRLNETEVKAAFLYHFPSYVEYPSGVFASPTSPFVIGVLGKHAILNALQTTVRGKTIKGRLVEIRQVSLSEQLRECHLLFIPEAEVVHLPKVLAILGNMPILLVGESESFATKGGIIGFFVEQNRVRFEVNPEAAKRANLQISAKLLSLAKIVKSDQRS